MIKNWGRKIIEDGVRKQFGYVIMDDPSDSSNLTYPWDRSRTVEVIGVRLKFVAAVAVADRYVQLSLFGINNPENSEHALYYSGNCGKITSGQSCYFHWWNEMDTVTSKKAFATDLLYNDFLPKLAIYRPTINIDGANFNAGDRLSECVIHFKEWEERGIE